MGSHPINLAIRFSLEVSGLIALGLLGWHYGKGFYKYVLALGFPVVAAFLWGAFAVPDDPSRSGDTIIQVTGVLRLLLELAFFTAATWSLFIIGAKSWALVYGVVVIVHYIISYDRVLWLIQQ